MGFAPGSASLHNALQTKRPYICKNACAVYALSICKSSVCKCADTRLPPTATAIHFLAASRQTVCLRLIRSLFRLLWSPPTLSTPKARPPVSCVGWLLKAWTSGKLLYSSPLVKDIRKHIPLDKEVMLGLDRLPAQSTAYFLKTCAELNIIPVYTPPDCTDVVAPIDHHLGAQLKRLMQGCYKEAVENFRSASTSQFQRRVMMAGRLSGAWKSMTLCKNTKS